MSLEARVAKGGNYHQADVDVVSDQRNWPRQQKKQQSSQDVVETAKEEKTEAEEDDGNDAED